MRYYLSDETLIIRGAFRACSTGYDGGIRSVTSLLTHPVTPSEYPGDEQQISNAAYRKGLSPEATFGHLIPARILQHAVYRFDQVTVFITAGVNTRNASNQETHNSAETPDYAIRIICTINDNLTEGDLLTALVAVSEVERDAFGNSEICSNWDRTGVIIGAIETGTPLSGSHVSWLGKLRDAVRYGVEDTIEHFSKSPDHSGVRPSFHIHTTIGGDRWIEWHKGGCPYYPCHFKGQRCDLCYCPLYPCEDESLGEWTTGSRSAGRVWSCAPCTLNHQPSVVKHLRRNPEASISELKSLLLHFPSK